MGKVLMPLEGVIYDVDGTMIDTPHPQYLWLKQCAEQYGGNPQGEFCPEWLSSYNRWLDEKGMFGLYEMIGVDFHQHSAAIWKEYNAFNQTHPIELVPGVRDAVTEIFDRSRIGMKRSNALRIGLNTTKSMKDIVVPLDGLLQYFDTVVAKDDIYNYVTDGEARKKSIPFDDVNALRKALPESVVKELEKPGSLGSWLSVQRLGIDPQSVIAFEDDARGVKSYKMVLMPKRRIDVYVVGVTWGYERDKGALLAAGADEVIDRPEQMVEIIGDLGGFSR